ncbi:MAG: hypothetical protein LBC34_03150 [Rickettsiales bacterium]|nr:hypothetical protein [Rickettsiales bacterium]
MPAGLSFKKDKATNTKDLSEAKIIVYEDGGGNKYILDASSASKLSVSEDIELGTLLSTLLNTVAFEYQGADDTKASKINSLGNIIGKLFATKNADTPNSQTILAEEAAKKPVAEAIFDATDPTNSNKNIAETKLGGKFAKKDGTNIDKDFAEKVLSATSDQAGKKSILVEKLGTFLEKTDETTEKVYGNSETPSSLKTAKDFLAEKSSFVKTNGSNATKELATAILTVGSGTSGTSVLKEKAADKDVAGAILGAKDGKKSILVEEFGKAFSDTTKEANYNNKGVKTAKAFLEGEGLGSATASDVATQLLDDDNKTTLATAVLDVKKDGANPTLETALAGNETFQTSVAGNLALKTAVVADEGFRGAVTSTLANLKALQDAVAGKKVLHDGVATQLLNDTNKGKLGTAVLDVKSTDNKTLGEQLAQIPDFKNGTKIQANAEDQSFQGAVRGVMSKPVFDIPTNENEPLSWDWI